MDAHPRVVEQQQRAIKQAAHGRLDRAKVQGERALQAEASKAENEVRAGEAPHAEAKSGVWVERQ